MLSVLDWQSTPPGGWKCRNKEDGVVVSAGIAAHLWRAWWAHRRSKGQPDLSQLEMENIFCRQLPSGCQTCGQPPINPHLYPELDAVTRMDREDKSVWGRAMWTILHQHRITEDNDKDWRWIRAYSFSIPCKISCKPHFDAYLADKPPDFSSQEAFSLWAYTCHQSVNARLGKLGITWEQYQKLYPVAN